MNNECCKTTIYLLLTSIVLLTAGPVTFAQETVTVKQGALEKEVLVLPFAYSTDKSMAEKDEVKVTHLPKDHAEFKSQLYQAALQTVSAGGNVLMLTRMNDHNQKGRYKIWGTAYHTDKYEELKAKTFEQKKKKWSDVDYGCLVIYRPLYNRAHNDEYDMELTINDTMKLNLGANAKYIIQVPKETDIKIANRKDLVVRHIRVAPGSRTFIRAYTNVPGSHKLIKNADSRVEMKGYAPYFELIDDAQGELESSLVTLATVTKKM